MIYYKYSSGLSIMLYKEDNGVLYVFHSSEKRWIPSEFDSVGELKCSLYAIVEELTEDELILELL